MNILDWLKSSNRWRHLAGGFLIGSFSDSYYCSLYASTLSAACLEYKDKAHGGKWDWVDFGLTVAGAIVGQIIRVLIWSN